ncbi:MAG: hypothetical protein J6R80_02705 [Kiritimatiellae bacterium]|nr:hypothetical protein [Kiritimatiellia bacterium]
MARLRGNRKIPNKMSVVAANSARFGGIILTFFIMVIFNLLSSSNCTMLLKEKGEKERELAKAEESRMREATRWEEMKTTERIEAALLRHGLLMRLPHSSQCVRMRPDGTPYPNQLSLARAKQSRFGAQQPASYRAHNSRSVRRSRAN